MSDWWYKTFPEGRKNVIIQDANDYPVQIAYGEAGTGVPVFLLHGVGSWSYNWRCSVKPLSPYFRVICCDAKGYGFSEKPLSRREQPGHQVVELARVIESLCDEPVVIVAESLGALTAIAVTQTYPHLVSRLVVVNVPIFANRLPHWGMSLLAKTPLEVIHAVDTLRLPYLFAPLVREIMAIERRNLLHDPKSLTAEDIYWITYPYIELPGTLTKVAEELQIAIREIEKYQAGKPNWLQTIQSRLSSIKIPVLILWGENDTWFPHYHGLKLHQCLPNSDLHILPRCGHDTSFDASELVNQKILSFLQDLA
ncbi:alpha/beta fold hydrolase [Calothrix sp. NIES-3974]|uniref:alpha/beta fold hydrolase n=1 Tax=Calothrix sp. NIES-3974 TaxID=2005462 RepID=UPI000B61CEEC|nr:alpha/beta hydrolase [Calothrix sp. NIES-3974]BAZ05755.1 alpha/beta hydrolase fold protein [Calothrix sp. NIES-3974]